MKRCSALILAAGESRRMGRLKQLLEIDGETLIARAVRIALGAGMRDVTVVLGANAEAISREVTGATVLINPDWAEGMASSIRLGVQALQSSEGIMILLVDQPTVTSEWLSELISAYQSQEADVVTTSKNGVTSPPAIFAPSMLERLMGLRGEKGAKSLFPGARVVEVEFPGELLDIDTPEDWQSTKQS